MHFKPFLLIAKLHIATFPSLSVHGFISNCFIFRSIKPHQASGSTDKYPLVQTRLM